MGVVSFAAALTAGSSNAIALAQSAASGVVLNGALSSTGVGVLDTQRRVIITSAGNDTNKTFTINGTNQSGTAISQTITGASGAAASSTIDFKTVTSVVASSTPAGSIQVGTSTVGSSPWQAANTWAQPMATQIVCTPTGTVNFTAEYTLDNDPCGIATRNVGPWNVVATSIAAATTASAATIGFPITAWRLTINSGTGSVAVQAVDQGA